MLTVRLNLLQRSNVDNGVRITLCEGAGFWDSIPATTASTLGGHDRQISTKRFFHKEYHAPVLPHELKRVLA